MGILDVLFAKDLSVERENALQIGIFSFAFFHTN